MTNTNSINRVHKSLDEALSLKRIVFWYDPKGEWEIEFNNYKNSSIEKRKVKNNEFSIKIEISRAPLNKNFLLYFKTEKPNEIDNWLLDLQLAGREFTADRASLDLQDAGLPLEFKSLAQEHRSFFRAPSRTLKLKQFIKANDDEDSVRLKMLAVIADEVPSIDHILLHCLNQINPEDSRITKTIDDLFGPFKLTDFFWSLIRNKFGYKSNEPNILDFAVELFKSSSSLTDENELEIHSKVFLSDWKDSRQNNDIFINWSKYIANVLKIDDIINDQLNEFDPGQDDSFESFELFTIHRIINYFFNKKDRASISEIIRNRETSFWSHGSFLSPLRSIHPDPHRNCVRRD